MVVDPEAYRWSDERWPGIRIERQVLYEMHIGAFTREGTFDAAARELSRLADLGITCIEIMPVGEFPGDFNWGYDGVDLYAPYHRYGDPDAFKRFVDAAHAQKLGVVLDVVYNHLGADGNYLPCFSSHYFTDRYANEWGEAINFDGPFCEPVREYFASNAEYWIREFHLDGLRVDATQSLHDASTPHIAAEIVARARAAARPREIILIAENEPQRAELMRPAAAGGMGFDAAWNDDFHHCARVALTGRRDGYFHDYRGRAQELASTVKRGFLFQGQYYYWQKKPRGSPAFDLPAHSFVHYTQNHDQVGNTFYGQRVHEITSPGRLRALTSLLLLAPQTPLIFMGQEFDASSPFTFFAHHNPELAAKVWAGRKKFMRQFAAYAVPEAQARLRDPSLAETFESSKLNHAERDDHRGTYELYRDLLAIRRNDPVIGAQRREAIDCAVLADHALLIRWFGGSEGDRLLLLNLGPQVELRPAPEPLLAPVAGSEWSLTWSSDDPRYTGPGVIDVCRSILELLPAESAMLLRSQAKEEPPSGR
jgi:maltooligosyltrehalose trehalohydrolase